MSVSKPKHADVRDPNKKIIQSTESITVMNITGTKVIEETFTNVLLDPDESNKDTSETQGKTTPTT